MKNGITRNTSSFWLLLVSLITFASSTQNALAAKSASPSSSSYVGAVYQAAPSSADLREITTLSDFTRMVYRDRWQGIEAEDVLKEFAKFKGAPNSPAMRIIWRDVLLGDFQGLEIDNAAQQTALMSERIRLLNRLGFFSEAVRLYQQASMKKPIPSSIVREGIDALALSGSADGACLEVTMATKYLAGDEWTQDAALCARYFGEVKQADELYQQALKIKAPKGGFKAVYNMLANGEAKAINVGIPPLWRTLLLAKGASVPAETLKQADAMTLAALAANKHVSLGVRLAAANRAADKGTIDFDLLRKLYETKHPTEATITGLIEQAKAGAPLAPSDYYSVARFTFEGNARSTVVKNGLHALHPITNIKSQVYGWIIDKLTLQVDKIKWFAPEGYAIMATTNRLDSADMYYDAGNLKKSPFAIIQALLVGKPWLPEQRQEWEQAMNQRFGDKSAEKTQRMFLTAMAYDQEKKLALQMDPKVKNDISTSPSILKESINNGGKGLTLLEALNVLAGKNQLKEMSTGQFVDIVENMTKQGLFGERKKLALEFLIQTVL